MQKAAQDFLDSWTRLNASLPKSIRDGDWQSFDWQAIFEFRDYVRHIADHGDIPIDN